MQSTSARMTAPMRRSLQARLTDLEGRISSLDEQRDGDDSLEATALLAQLDRERSDIIEALRDATLIDDEPFDTQAIEVGDSVTIRDLDGTTDCYVLVDGGVRSRARSDWVSVSSPLGNAILGRAKGESVRVESPAGPVTYVIVDFERRSDDAHVLATAPEQGHVGPLSLLPSEAFLG
jgi:transcription elongation GreA/GreB family factor